MYIASEHIQEWIKNGKALVVPVEISTHFGQYLNGLPWLANGGGLDWSRIRGSEGALATMDEMQQTSWLVSTLMGRDPCWAFWYSQNEACIACESVFAFSNIDRAFWKAPGKRYLFGGSIIDGKFEPIFCHFAEYDGADTLIAAL